MSSSLTWRSNNGTEWVFDGLQGVQVVNTAEGVFTIPTDLLIDQRVGDGGVLVNSRRSPRRVVFDFLLVDDAGYASDLSALWRSLLSSLIPGGQFVYAGPNGTYTLNQVVIEAPDRSMTGQDLAYRSDDVFSVSFLALDPLWVGTRVEYTGGFVDPTPFNANIAFNANIPFNGGSSADITVAGHEATYPLFLAQGPLTSLTVAVGGSQWALAQPLLAGEWMSVDTSPGKRGPHRGASGLVPGVPDEAVDWNLLNKAAQLGTLEPGVQQVVFGATGFAGASSWLMAWEPRFLTP